jgi:hypothetical protein
MANMCQSPEPGFCVGKIEKGNYFFNTSMGMKRQGEYLTLYTEAIWVFGVLGSTPVKYASLSLS